MPQLRRMYIMDKDTIYVRYKHEQDITFRGRPEPYNRALIRFQKGQVFKNGALLDLTAAEYKLLCLFRRNPNAVLTKGQILDKLWDCDGNYIDSGTLTVYIRRLRMKIEDDPGAPQMLLTVRSMGYKWNVID